jgi:hypothetical protein
VTALALLVPALLSGCSLLGSSSEAIGDRGAEGAGSADGPSWIVATQGSATPSPRPSHPAAAATPSAASGFVPRTAATPARTPTPTCSPNSFSFSKIDGLAVTPGATSAMLSWYNVGGDNLIEFRLYAISQDLKTGKQRDVTVVTVKPRMPCGEMTGTIGNLDRRTHYVFSVDAVVTRRSGDGTHAATVARSHSISTT